MVAVIVKPINIMNRAVGREWSALCGYGGTGRRQGLKIPCSQERVGSNPTIRTSPLWADFFCVFSFLASRKDEKMTGLSSLSGELAQSVEHLLCKQKVMGSKPIFSTYAVAE